MSLQVRHRRPAQRRQVHPLQRAHQGRHRGRELPVLHHRAQRRRRRGARPAAGAAGRRSSSRRRSIPAIVEFVDIAGLVAGASKGEGLGNQFLANIRETDAIVARGALLRGRRTSSTSPARSTRSPTSRSSRPSSRWPTWRRSSKSLRALRQGRQDRRRQGSAAPGRRCWRSAQAALDAGAPGAHARLQQGRAGGAAGRCA